MSEIEAQAPLLFSPMTVSGLTLKNRIVISPMCQYSAHDGLANAWHNVHLGQFALGGAGMVFCEAAAVEPRGRITYGDLGIWSADHGVALKPIVSFLKATAPFRACNSPTPAARPVCSVPGMVTARWMTATSRAAR